MVNKFKVGDVVKLNDLAIDDGDYCSNCKNHELTIIKLPQYGFNNYTIRGKSRTEGKPERHLKLIRHLSWKDRFEGKNV